MGCDIHLHVEIKIEEKWLHYNHPQIERCYMLFAKMAGVRNDPFKAEPISTPRGLPPDISDSTKFDYNLWDCDAHSMSWLSALEVCELEKWYNKENLDSEFGHLFGSSFSEHEEDFRFVFWFDN